MKTILKLIAVIPWWVVARLGRMDKYDRDYDWRTFRGWLCSPLTRTGYIIGGTYWLVLLAGTIALPKWLFCSS